MARDTNPKFDPNKHHRKSIRIKEYDYAQAGAYFVTIVTYQRDCLFGKIENEIMVLNDFGKIADECWRAIPEHFQNVELGAYVIMPNHVHGMVVIRDDESASDAVDTQHVGATHWVAPTNPNARPNGPKRGSLGAIIGSYKMAVTRQIQHKHNATGIWQRNYYEHIIRNADEANRIHLYIEANPAQWDTDDENPSNNRG
jgi:putative transposase